MFPLTPNQNKTDLATQSLNKDFPFKSLKPEPSVMTDSSAPVANAAVTTGHLDQAGSTLPSIKVQPRQVSRNKIIPNNMMGRKKPNNPLEKSAMATIVNNIIRAQLEKKSDWKSKVLGFLENKAVNTIVPLAAGTGAYAVSKQEGLPTGVSIGAGLGTGLLASPRLASSALRASGANAFEKLHPKEIYPGFWNAFSNNYNSPLLSKAKLVGLGAAPALINSVVRTGKSTEEAAQNLAEASKHTSSLSQKIDNFISHMAGAREIGRESVGGAAEGIGNLIKNPYVLGTAGGIGAAYGGYKLLSRYLQHQEKMEKAKALAANPRPPKQKVNVVDLQEVLTRLNKAQHPGTEVPPVTE